MSDEIRFTILGVAASKANSRRHVNFGGKSASIKSPGAMEFERGALQQIPIRFRLQLTCDVAVTMHMFYPNRRSDLDESVVLDVLQNRFHTKLGQRFCVQRGVYENDRQVKEKHIFWHLDPDNPRVEILVKPIEAGLQAGLFGAGEVQPVGRPSDKALAVAQAASRARLSRLAREVDVDFPGNDGQPF